MINLIYSIEFLSDWHCGSGLSSGANVDDLCIKDAEELPFIPGKTLKGLFRDAAGVIFDSNNIFIEKCFGLATTNDEANDETTKGSCFFSSAELSQKLKNYLEEDIGNKDSLYRKVSATAIDEKTGEAVEHSLRRMEVVVPLTLYAKIVDIPDEETKDKLIECMQYIKRMGSNRNRGLGRCVLTKCLPEKGE